MRILPQFIAVATASLLLITVGPGCGRGPACPDITGRWTSDDGQEFVFGPDGRALWLTRFGSQIDTVTSAYSLDCAQQPAAIDFTNFSSGPYADHALRGIVEATNDQTLRLRYGPESTRPAAFDGETVSLKRAVGE